MMEVAGRFLGGWLEQVTTWLQIKFKYPYLFSSFTKIYLKSRNVSGTLGIFENSKEKGL